MSCYCAQLSMLSTGFPFTWASNFGGRVQINTMPADFSIQRALNAQLMLARIQNPCLGSSMMMSQYPVAMQQGMYPQTGMQYGDQSTLQGYIDGRKTRISIISNQTTQNLLASKTELEQLVNDPSTTEDQKTEINKFLTKIAQIETELQKAVQNAQAANTAEILDQINIQVESLAGIAQELISMIPDMLKILIQEAEQVAESEENAPVNPDGASADGGVPIEGESDVPIESEGDIEVIAPAGSDPNESLITTTHKDVSEEVQSIAADIYKAVNGISFSNKNLETAIDKINKDNVLDLFDHWNNTYGRGYINSDKKGLIETIYGEYHFYNGGNAQVQHILDALMEKAQEFDASAMQEIRPYEAKIISELNAKFNTSESKVAEAINTIVLILNAYQAQQEAAAKA